MSGEITVTPSAAQWDEFVRTEPDASVYHLWGWRSVFERAFGLETTYLAAADGGQIAGILPLVIFRSRWFGRFAVSLPFVDNGGVCARDPAVAQRLLAHATTIANEQQLSHLELRHGAQRQFAELPARAHKVAMHLTLERDPARAWQLLDRKVRNQVRKAEKSALVVRAGGAELVADFYRVFARNMRDLGTPVWPRQVFSVALGTFGDAARVFLVEHQGAVVAGGVAIVHRHVVTVPWASSLREYRAMCPNNLLYWRIIEHAIAAGATTLDFGRSTPGEGTYQFKEQWGARPTPLHWEYLLVHGKQLPNLTPTNPKFRTAIETWKRLPLPVAQWLGPRISCSIP